MNQRPYRGVKPPPSLVKGTERFEKLYALSQGNPRHKASTTIQPAQPLPCYRFIPLPTLSISASQSPGSHPHLNYAGQGPNNVDSAITWFDSADHSRHFPFRLRDTRVGYKVHPTRFAYTCTVTDEISGGSAIYYDGYARIYLCLYREDGTLIEPPDEICRFVQGAGGSGGSTVGMSTQVVFETFGPSATHPQAWETGSDPITTLYAHGIGLRAKLYTNASISVTFDNFVVMEYEIGL